MDVRAIVDCKTSLGEGPIWDVQDQKIYWVDSLGNKIFRANQDGSGVEAWDVPGKIGSLAIRNGGGAILSLQNGFHAFSFETGKGTLLLDPEPALDGNRLNDGKVDRKGRFVCGSMHMKETDKTASLYRLDPDLSLHKLEGDIIVSNGPCWSPDDKTFYFSDSWSMEISAYDWDAVSGTHRNLVANALVCRAHFELNATSRIFGLAPLFHVTGFEIQLVGAFAAGASQVLTYRFHPSVALEAFLEHRPTFIIGAITAFIALMNHKDVTREHFSRFEYLYSGGDPDTAGCH
jgi:hypothetical protein